MSRRTRRIAALIATLGVLAGILAVAVGGASGAADCSKTFVVGVRGVGESDTKYAGYGVEVQQAIRSFTDAYGHSVDAVPLQYPNASLLTFVSNLSQTLDSVNAGVADLNRVLYAQASACHDQSIALFGYSEGALVIHETLLSLDQEISDRIVGIGLLADPVRIGADSYNIGSASKSLNGIGLAHIGSVNSGFPARPVPSVLQSRTYSLCDAGDPVCAFDPRDVIGSNGLSTLLKISAAIVRHLLYSHNGHATSLGTRVGEVARTTVNPSNTSSSLGATSTSSSTSQPSSSTSASTSTSIVVEVAQ